jgi:transposase InsO family protein
MKDIGIEGVIRGKKPKTTIPDKALPCPLDRVNRQFHAPAPNVLWVSDFTYVATWQGFAYVAFVIDVFARRIVGWRASRTASAGFVLDALEQAIHQRRINWSIIRIAGPKADSIGRRNGSKLEVVMTIRKRASDRSSREKVSSPGRPKAAHRAQHVLFWRLIGKGLSSEEAAVQVGASAPVGSRCNLRP